MPLRAIPFERTVISNVRLVWGLNGPVATVSGQIEAESSWKPDARSPYAAGLAQVTPDTAEWLSAKYHDLYRADPLEPAWAIRALARYDFYLWSRQPNAVDDCNRWAFTLSAYNGGEGWVNRDKALAAAHGSNTQKWWENVEKWSPRSEAAFTENRAYPRSILFNRQQHYITWGPVVICHF